jgi:hypothetical protein
VVEGGSARLHDLPRQFSASTAPLEAVAYEPAAWHHVDVLQDTLSSAASTLLAGFGDATRFRLVPVHTSTRVYSNPPDLL